MEDLTYKIRVDQDDLTMQLQALSQTVAGFFNSVISPMNTALNQLGAVTQRAVMGGLGQGGVSSYLPSTSTAVSRLLAAGMPPALYSTVMSPIQAAAQNAQVGPIAPPTAPMYNPAMDNLVKPSVFDVWMEDHFNYFRNKKDRVIESNLALQTPWIPTTEALNIYKENKDILRAGNQFFLEHPIKYATSLGANMAGSALEFSIGGAMGTGIGKLAGAGTSSLLSYISGAAPEAISGLVGGPAAAIVGLLSSIAVMSPDLIDYIPGGKYVKPVFQTLHDISMIPGDIINIGLKNAGIMPASSLTEVSPMAFTIKAIADKTLTGPNSRNPYGRGITTIGAFKKSLEIEDIVSSALNSVEGSTMGRPELMETVNYMMRVGAINPFSPEGKLKEAIKKIVSGSIQKYTYYAEAGAKEALQEYQSLKNIGYGAAFDVENQFTNIGIASKITGISMSSFIERAGQISSSMRGMGFKPGVAADIAREGMMLGYGGILKGVDPFALAQAGGISGVSSMTENILLKARTLPMFQRLVAAGWTPGTKTTNPEIFKKYLSGEISFNEIINMSNENVAGEKGSFFVSYANEIGSNIPIEQSYELIRKLGEDIATQSFGKDYTHYQYLRSLGQVVGETNPYKLEVISNIISPISGSRKMQVINKQIQYDNSSILANVYRKRLYRSAGRQVSWWHPWDKLKSLVGLGDNQIKEYYRSNWRANQYAYLSKLETEGFTKASIYDSAYKVIDDVSSALGNNAGDLGKRSLNLSQKLELDIEQKAIMNTYSILNRMNAQDFDDFTLMQKQMIQLSSDTQDRIDAQIASFTSEIDNAEKKNIFEFGGYASVVQASVGSVPRVIQRDIMALTTGVADFNSPEYNGLVRWLEGNDKVSSSDAGKRLLTMVKGLGGMSAEERRGALEGLSMGFSGYMFGNATMSLITKGKLQAHNPLIDWFKMSVAPQTNIVDVYKEQYNRKFSKGFIMTQGETSRNIKNILFTMRNPGSGSDVIPKAIGYEKAGTYESLAIGALVNIAAKKGPEAYRKAVESIKKGVIPADILRDLTLTSGGVSGLLEGSIATEMERTLSSVRDVDMTIALKKDLALLNIDPSLYDNPEDVTLKINEALKSGGILTNFALEGLQKAIKASPFLQQGVPNYYTYYKDLENKVTAAQTFQAKINMFKRVMGRSQATDILTEFIQGDQDLISYLHTLGKGRLKAIESNKLLSPYGIASLANIEESKQYSINELKKNRIFSAMLSRSADFQKEIANKEAISGGELMGFFKGHSVLSRAAVLGIADITEEERKMNRVKIHNIDTNIEAISRIVIAAGTKYLATMGDVVTDKTEEVVEELLNGLNLPSYSVTQTSENKKGDTPQ